MNFFEPDEVGLALVQGKLTVGLFAGFLLATVYSIVCHLALGRSLGKLLMGTEVVRSKDGGKPEASQFILRSLVSVVGSLFAGLAVFSPLLSAKSRGIHDVLSGTTVIRR